MASDLRFKPAAEGGMTPQMKQSWEENGFLVLEGFKSLAECDALTERAKQIACEADLSNADTFTTRHEAADRDAYFRDSGDKIRCFLEEEAVDQYGQLLTDQNGQLLVAQEKAINKIGHAMHDLDPVFDGFSHSAQLATLARDAGLADARVMQSMFIFKSPEIGGEVQWHQDGTYLYTEPQSVIGFWFALDDATLENGCLYVIPGGHKGGLKSRFVRLGKGFATNLLEASDYQTEDAVALEAKKGDLVMLHGRLPHASEYNRSNLSRHAYTLHVIDGACDYPKDNWLQRSDDLTLRGFY